MSTAGPNSAGAGANVNKGLTDWSTPSNITASDDSRATVVAASDYLAATSFGFAIPAGSSIDGITAEIEASESGGNYSIGEVYGTKDGSNLVGDNQTGPQALTTTDTYYTFGGAADTWGTTWTVAEINASTFGIMVAGGSGGGITGRVDHIRVTITYTEGGAPAGNPYHAYAQQ